MPRYYFDIDNGGSLRSDEEGRDCPTDAEAKAAGRLELLSLVKRHLTLSSGDRTLTVWVRDEAGDGLFQLCIDYTVTRLQQ